MSAWSRTVFAHAISGSIGSMLAMMLTYPLDRIRTLKQLGHDKQSSTTLELLRWIVRQEGWTGLYDGLQPMLIALGVSNFVYFYWFTMLKVLYQLIIRKWKAAGKAIATDGESPLTNLAIASLAGTVNVFITTPLWVAYTRLALKKNSITNDVPVKSMSGMIAHIAKTEGAKALWSGIGPSLVLVSNPSVQFASYEWMRDILLKWKFSQNHDDDFIHLDDMEEDMDINVVREAVRGPELSSVDYLILGAVAKMIATFVTYPLQVAQTRLRARISNMKNKDSNEKSKSTSTLGIILEVYNEEGVKGLYSGMEAKMIQTCMTSAFMFMAYETISRFILRFILFRKYKKKIA